MYTGSARMSVISTRTSSWNCSCVSFRCWLCQPNWHDGALDCTHHALLPPSSNRALFGNETIKRNLPNLPNLRKQVVALDGTIIHVTCTQGGFYVNGSMRGNFDPKPIAGNPCYSHELAVCLLSRNPSFAKVCCCCNRVIFVPTDERERCRK